MLVLFGFHSTSLKDAVMLLWSCRHLHLSIKPGCPKSSWVRRSLLLSVSKTGGCRLSCRFKRDYEVKHEMFWKLYFFSNYFSSVSESHLPVFEAHLWRTVVTNRSAENSVRSPAFALRGQFGINQLHHLHNMDFIWRKTEELKVYVVSIGVGELVFSAAVLLSGSNS